jgi:hypothetical protein
MYSYITISDLLAKYYGAARGPPLGDEQLVLGAGAIPGGHCALDVEDSLPLTPSVESNTFSALATFAASLDELLASSEIF